MFGCDCLLSLYNLQLHAESTTSSSDPCYDYNTLDEYGRDIRQNPYQYSGHDDTLVEWSGWYRLYLNGESAQMSEWCVSYVGCGGYTGLYLNGSHPTLEDGVVTREVLGSYMWWWGYSNQCGAYNSTSIQVKACPGDYYVYELVKPIISAPGPTYCAVAFQSFSSDPCYNYESLDRPWRANNESGDWICDNSFSWNGWYRLFYYGMNIQMPETCVSSYTCNTYISLWLNGPHPQIEDGVVTREVCGGSYWGGCCDYKTNPIRVKACPGNYYVYELVKPQIGCSGYCTDVSTISQAASTVSPDIVTGTSIILNYDPCESYNVLNNHWRSTLNYWSTYGYISDHDDTSIEWDGWYRLFINGSSAQMPEWCMSYMSCGGFSSLWLGGHPRLEDGVATREIYGSYFDQCSHYRSDSIQVKACPGNYYVYKFTRPPLSIPAPVYCAVPFTTPSVDPCYSYTSLDEPWRATNNPYYNNNYYHNMCDYNVEWNGWYRMFYDGQNSQMPESCVNQGMCGTQYPLWLTSPHPQLEDGVVTRQVCASAWYGCCTYTSHPIRVKACPGNYYVYEFVKPMFCSAFCIVPEASNQSTPSVSTTTETIPPIESITPPITTTAPSVDPCYNYNVLDDLWRSTNNQHSSQIMCDTTVSWNGWYRLFIQGQSVHMPDTCVDMLSCGTHAPLWLNGGHPTVEDGVVTRHVCGHWSNNCCYFQSNPIKVKACPGGYYVYEFVRPSACSLAYCADARNINITSTTVMPETTTTTETTAETTLPAPSVDPCYNYNVLDDLWRSTNNQHSSQIMCDTTVSWNGWYRLFIQGQSVHMPDTCVDMLSCGTHAPLWLNGGHPTVEDGVVTRDVCGHWSNNCCYFQSNPIKVKACPGGYYVYEFVRPSACGLAYCADARNINITSTTVMPETSTTTETTAETTLPVNRNPCSELNCSDDERCGMKNGVYGCLCKKDQHRQQQHHDSFDFSETCESSSGSMSVSRCQLFEAGFPADVLHLNDPSCKGMVQNGRVEFHFDNDEHICGTNLLANGTHFIYSNCILGTPRSEDLISREKILKLSFSCVYPQTQTLSMNVEINPLESIVHRTLPAGEGRYQVRMIPYEDDEFTRPFTGRVDAELDQKMNVEVRVEGVDSHQFALVMDTCWATPVNDPDYSLRWDLILTECPNPNDDTVELLQNGVSTSSRFSFRMFIFTANSTKLYLHCAVHLCLLSSNRCSTDCNSGHQRRERRSLDFHDSASISLGPLMLSEGNTDKWIPEQVKDLAPIWITLPDTNVHSPVSDNGGICYACRLQHIQDKSDTEKLSEKAKSM
uniref:Zgc:153932 n=1 Tax=Cyprinus carpio TaxID=7962 RepID=A0A8C2DEP3_CYPCA